MADGGREQRGARSGRGHNRSDPKSDGRARAVYCGRERRTGQEKLSQSSGAAGVHSQGKRETARTGDPDGERPGGTNGSGADIGADL